MRLAHHLSEKENTRRHKENMILAAFKDMAFSERDNIRSLALVKGHTFTARDFSSVFANCLTAASVWLEVSSLITGPCDVQR